MHALGRLGPGLSKHRCSGLAGVAELQRRAATDDVMSSFYTAMAVGGSMVVSFSTIPQIYHLYKRQSSHDISYVYQVRLS